MIIPDVKKQKQNQKKIVNAAKLLKTKGADNIYLIATHGILSG